MALIGVEVVTPEKNLFTGAAVSVVTKTSEGDLTVMAEHAELIGDVVPGITKLELASGEIMDVVVHGGFLQVHTQEGAADDLFGDGEAAPEPIFGRLRQQVRIAAELVRPSVHQEIFG